MVVFAIVLTILLYAGFSFLILLIGPMAVLIYLGVGVSIVVFSHLKNVISDTKWKWTFQEVISVIIAWPFIPYFVMRYG